MGCRSVGSEHAVSGAGFVGSIYQSDMATWARSERHAASMARSCSCPDTSISTVDDARTEHRCMGVVGSAEPAKPARKWWISKSSPTPNI